MRRFYLDSPLPDGIAETHLSPAESRHITKVLRLAPGTAVELYDGHGFLYQATLSEIGKKVIALVHAKEFHEPRQPVLILHIGLLKNKKMEFVIQKATELGVSEIQLFTSDHTNVNPPDAKRMARFKKIMQESCKQCERLHPVHIVGTTPLADQIKTLHKTDCCYLFWERETHNTPNLINSNNNTHPVHVFIGPEGGFSPVEIKNLPATITSISLGPQILRAETAVITSLAITSYLTGRLNP